MESELSDASTSGGSDALETVMNRFDTSLDPFEFFLWPTYGTPPRVRACLLEMPGRIHPNALLVIDAVCAGFIAFAENRLEGTPTGWELPEDYLARRKAIECRWPRRAQLLSCVREQLETYESDGGPLFVHPGQ